MIFGRFLLRSVIVFVVGTVMGFLGHGLWLHRDYMTLGPMMRTEAAQQAYFPWLLLGFAIYSVALVWMYAQGNSGRPWLGQGIRFGVAVWAIASVPMYLVNYSVAPWPGIIVVKQICWDFIALVTLGVVVAALSRKDATRAAGGAM